MGARDSIHLLVRPDTDEGFVVKGLLNKTEKALLEKVFHAKLVQGTLENTSNIGTRAGAMSPASSNIARILDDVGFDKKVTVEPVSLNTEQDPKHDRMTQGVYHTNELNKMFVSAEPIGVEYLDLQNNGIEVLKDWCKGVGTSLNDGMMNRLITVSKKQDRALTDVECFAFAQANSEHCRHQTFNAQWKIDGKLKKKTLFELIKDTYKANPDRVPSAYSDNAAVVRRENDEKMQMLKIDGKTRQYHFHETKAFATAKVETHNHPTAIAPFPGAATGTGGEIRDEAATGIGGKTAHGLAGFVVSDSLYGDPYKVGQNPGLATPLEIMTDGPLGATAFSNEYGRPSATGIFNAYSARTSDGRDLGFVKPVMLAGGTGMIEKRNAFKPKKIPVGTRLVQIGGPNLRIGLGGASGSSVDLSGNAIDYSSVQRGNAEMQRRCQKVIDRCAQKRKGNPILAIHDCGAGGIGNAFVELGAMGKKGAEFWIDKAMIADPSLSLREIWSNESQERYVIAISDKNFTEFEEICRQEGVPLAWMGMVTKGNSFHVKNGNEDVINMPFKDFFYEESPVIEAETLKDRGLTPLELSMNVKKAVSAVLAHPTVGDKSFLVTIGDQTVGGLTTQNQMAGPWRVPVTDVAVQRDGFREKTGNAMVSAEAISIAPIDPAASVRMAITEALTNLLAADVSNIRNVIFSGNWMANLKDKVQYVDLYTAVQAARDFCIELGIAIPTGKDSLSMQATWENKLAELKKHVKIGAPVTGIFTAFAPVKNAKNTLTPYLQPIADTELLFIDLAKGKQRLGGSILAQVHKQIGDECPDMDAKTLKNLYKAIIELKRAGKILAYHDRSAGGLMATLSEMAFASHCGLDIDMSFLCEDDSNDAILQALFNQEGGIVIQVSKKDKKSVLKVLAERDLFNDTYSIAVPRFDKNPSINIGYDDDTLFSARTASLHKTWSTISDRIRAQRENPETAMMESKVAHDYSRPAIEYKRTFDLENHPAHKIIKNAKKKPKVAILRAPGTNGDQEMANKFLMAGFDAYDVNMKDIREGRFNLEDFQGFAACGGFSYGDTLGAGEGWAQSILQSKEMSKQFREFFERSDTFSIGVCNGCQMMSKLKDLIPGANHFPEFKKNTSHVFESRSVDVTIPDSASIAFRGMEGSVLPIVISHGEGRARGGQVQSAVMQFVDGKGKPSDTYPCNPNGSSLGGTAYTNTDGRHNIMMPHPERTDDFDYMFYNLRAWAEENKKQ